MEKWRQRFHDRVREAAETTQITPHRKSTEFLYRTGFGMQALGLAALLFSQNPLWCAAGYTLINFGVLLSGWLLQVYIREIRVFILAVTVIGCLIQVAGIAGVATVMLATGELSPIKYLIPIGLGFVFAGACGIAGKEAFCYRFQEGWYLMPVLALVIIAFLVQYATGFTLASQVTLAVALALQLSLTVRKFRLPYAAACRSEGN